MTEILTVEDVSHIREYARSKLIVKLCDGHETLRGQLAKAELEFQDVTTVRDTEQMWRQELQTDLLALAEVLIEIDERVRNNIGDHCNGCNGSDCMWDPFAHGITDGMHAALALPGVQRVLAKKEAP